MRIGLGSPGYSGCILAPPIAEEEGVSQTDEILRDLKAGKKLTPLDSLDEHNCWRLGARIYDLRRQGFDIKTERITDERTGKTYARYSMA